MRLDPTLALAVASDEAAPVRVHSLVLYFRILKGIARAATRERERLEAGS